MENTSYIALSRQTALWRQLEAVANNMANANTTGYKSEDMMFTDYMVKTKSEDSAFGRKLSFTHDYGVVRDTREGPMTQTSNQLDVAINGEGYLTVDTAGGDRYTRDGHFRLDENGMVVNASGNPVMLTNNQPLVLAPTETQISIAADGSVSTENGLVGKLKVVKFENEQAMQKVGDNTYQTDETPTDVSQPRIVQGMLEESNVQPVVQMTNMISLLRNYQNVQKLIDSESDRQSKAIQTLSQSKTNNA